jgi:hypothetical protein
VTAASIPAGWSFSLQPKDASRRSVLVAWHQCTAHPSLSRVAQPHHADVSTPDSWHLMQTVTLPGDRHTHNHTGWQLAPRHMSPHFPLPLSGSSPGLLAEGPPRNQSACKEPTRTHTPAMISLAQQGGRTLPQPCLGPAALLRRPACQPPDPTVDHPLDGPRQRSLHCEATGVVSTVVQTLPWVWQPPWAALQAPCPLLVLPPSQTRAWLPPPQHSPLL